MLIGGPQRDDNGYPSWAGISCVDGVTIVPIQFNPATGGMMIDSTTVISFTPTKINTVGETPFIQGVSTADGKTALPFYVNPTNGGVLINLI